MAAGSDGFTAVSSKECPMFSRVSLALGAATVLLALTPGAARAACRYSPLDEQSLQTSIQGDRFEIAGGKIAAAKAVTPGVRALAVRLRRDHTKSLREAVAVAHRLRIDVPAKPSPTEEWELQTVAAMSGEPFDAAYAYLEIQDHKQDIEEANMERMHGRNAGVRALARSDLPVLRKHLRVSKLALWAIPGAWPPEPAAK
jgi:putative membrane protein